MPKQGLISGDVNRFVRCWYECSAINVSVFESCSPKWFPYSNGGDYRRWFGNNTDVVNWENNGDEIIHFVDEKGRQRSRPQNQQFYLKEGGTWSAITSGDFSVRYYPSGYLFSNAGMAIFADHLELLYIIGLLNTSVCARLLSCMNEGLNFNAGDIARVPISQGCRAEEVIAIVRGQIDLSKYDWDSFETSWDFQRHPLVASAINQHYLRLSDCWREWEQACNERFTQLKDNEEELNRIFIDIYGLQDELTPEVDDRDVTVRRADLGRDIRSLISYAVGCMLGRYSLDKPGLAFAGADWQGWLAQQDAMTYAPDKDGILPITDDEYFYDDIVTLFVDWVKTVYGEATLEENLTFIANALGGKGSPREVIREYFLNDFYKDHLKIYQKRPIYWLFDSGKKNGFKALVYMHRWQPDTIARVRTDYVHEMQSRYRTAIADVEQRINGASTSERVKLTKRLTALQAQAEELRKYEEKVHHLADQMIGIDLDDGVKVNYAKFADVLAPIK